MVYEKKSELPDSVKENLPAHAQDIFKEAFNSAYQEHDKEEVAFKIAWSAVKEEYEKQDGEWVKKDSG